MGYRLVPSFLAASPEEVVFPDAFVSKTHTEVAQDQQPAPARACTRAARVLLGVLLLAGLSLSPLRAQTVTFQGLITTVAGNGALGYSGDGGAATSAKLNVPSGVAVDGVGNLYIADAGNNRIRRVAPDGIITTVAGTGIYGYDGDNIPATSAELNSPAGVAVDGAGNLYIADEANDRIRKVGTGVGPQCTTSNPNPNPNPASFAAVGDFNGDCKSDILWRNNTTQQVYEWFMNGTTYSGSGSPGSPTSDWVIQSAGDFDGDGKADILLTCPQTPHR